MIFFVIIAIFFAAFAGGAFALRFQDKLHLFLGFSAGAIIGAALFNLLPEALEQASGVLSVTSITGIIAAGFIIYMMFDRLVLFHPYIHDDCQNHHHQNQGALGATTLALHSILDGLAIGWAFQSSEAVGLVVAIAIIIHRFSDGINIVGFILKAKQSGSRAKNWLILIAIAPIAGLLIAYFIRLPEEILLGPILAFFGGSFLYMGASELLPESHHEHSTKMTSLMTILGFLVIYLAVLIGHG